MLHFTQIRPTAKHMIAI